MPAVYRPTGPDGRLVTAGHDGVMADIHLRDMRAEEYDAYTAERERDTVGSLTGVLPAGWPYGPI